MTDIGAVGAGRDVGAPTAVDGRTTAITVLTPVRSGHTALLRIVLFLGAHVKQLNEALEKLSFIHYARWTIITDLPYNGPPQKREGLHYDYLFFETNFNGTWDEYIDAFSEVVPERMQAIWGSSFGFPGPQPVGPFKAYIHANDLPIAHYYAAYPEATTKAILAALRVQEQVTDFNTRTADVQAPEEFHRAYLELITRLQHDL
jgi:hypothetical protein